MKKDLCFLRFDVNDPDTVKVFVELKPSESNLVSVNQTSVSVLFR